MKKLNTEEIEHFAFVLGFTESEAKEITDLFYNLKMENSWKVDMPLNGVDEYYLSMEKSFYSSHFDMLLNNIVIVILNFLVLFRQILIRSPFH